MQRKRQQQQQQASGSAETAMLDSWVSSDHHFVPARPANASDAPPPAPRPPLSAAAAAAASLLAFRRTPSGAGYAVNRSSSHGGSTAAPTAPKVDRPVLTSTCIPSTGLWAFDADNHPTASLAVTPRQQAAPPQLPPVAAAPHRLTPAQSPAGAGVSGPDLSRPPRRADVGSAAAAALTPGRASTIGGASSAASGLPETPCPRSPEWSPRRRARSSGSSRSLTLAASPAAASDARPQTEGGLLYDNYAARGGRCEERAASTGHDGVGGGGIAGGESVWVRAAGGRVWGPADGLPGGGSGEGGWKSSEDGGDLGMGRRASSCGAHAHVAAPLPVVAPSAATPLMAPDPRDLSFALGVLGAVRCAVSAARGCGGAGAGVGGRSRPSGIAPGGLGGDVPSSADVGAGLAMGSVMPPDAVAASDGLKLKCDGVNAASALGGEADGAAAAVAAAPTSILLLVLAVRLFRAAVRWPAAASLCATVTWVVAAWLAAAAALFAAARAVARAAHLMARVALAVVAWCMGARAAAAASPFQAAARPPPLPASPW